MSTIVYLSGNPNGYGARTLEQVLKYLTRSVNQSCYASDEEQYAAQLLRDMQSQIYALEQEVRNLAGHIEELKSEYELDGKRLAYCVTNGVFLDKDQCLYSDLDKEEVINGNHRQALDRLMNI